ncbi:MAG: nicotinate-nucleotide adenylyltransferase [Pseudomonadales bacterium]|nr:nicotinate-nucleotide adenylyltransferase [Pseudomonadales bacterium]
MIGLLGGTFDPIHLGHLHAARSVCVALALERIRLLLAARPGHRAAPVASIEHRWRMLELACADDPRLVADDREVRRAARLARPSYTVDTLEELRAEAPDEALCWVVGSDAYRGLLGWHRWPDILTLAHLVVLQRPGVPLDLPEALARLSDERRVETVPSTGAGSVLFLELPMLAISASAVRAALAGGASVADLLPPAVCTYITNHRLYGVASDPGSAA